MKLKFLLATLLVGASISSFAQGVKDGIDFYKIGDYENAKTILDRNSGSATNQAEVDYYYGMLAFQAKKNDEAKSYFDKGVAANAAYPYNYVGKGAVALKNGNKSEAEQLFKQARGLSKKDSKLEIAIARAYYAANPTTYAKQIDKSVADARKWKNTDPEADIFEGDVKYAKEDWGGATGNYEMAMSLDPANIEATVKYADTYYHVNPQYALAELSKIIETHPNSALVQRQLAEKLYDNGNYAEAAKRYGNYINSSNNYFPKDQARYAQLLFLSDQVDKSVEVSNSLKSKVSTNDPYYYVANRLLMFGYNAKKDYASAIAAGKELFSAQNGQAEYNYKDYLEYAKALEKANMNAESLAAYDNAIKLAPEKDKLVVLRGLFKQYSKNKQYDKALEYAQKVLDSPDCEADDYNSVAEVYMEMADAEGVTPEAKTAALNDAVTYLDKALEKDPTNISYLYNKSYVQYEQENWNITGNALETMQKLASALSAYESNSKFYPSLAYTYQYLAAYEFTVSKDREKAAEYANKLLQFSPENKVANQILSTVNAAK